MLKRKCPNCGKELFYSIKSCLDRAKKQNTTCRVCALTGRKFSDNAKQNMSKSSTHYWKGKIRSDETKQKISKSNSGKNHYLYGKKRSEETKRKIRLSIIKNIEDRCGQIYPNYNPIACKIIDKYGKKHGFDFQHAENGGEVCIDGYWPDGIDKRRKTIIEVDEKYHFNNDGILKEKDIQRQVYLESLGYKFIRVRM